MYWLPATLGFSNALDFYIKKKNKAGKSQVLLIRTPSPVLLVFLLHVWAFHNKFFWRCPCLSQTLWLFDALKCNINIPSCCLVASLDAFPQFIAAVW